MFWLGLAVSLCYVPGVTGAYIATQWALLSIVLPFALLRGGPFTIFHALGLLFVGYVVAHAFSTPAPYAAVFGTWLIVIMALSVWFGTVALNMRSLYAGLAVGASVSSLAAVLQYFGVVQIPGTTLAPAGLYVNSVQQGTVLALVAVALVTERMWLWLLPLAPGLVLAGSRGALLALTVGLAAAYFRRAWVLVLVLACGAVAFALPLSNSDQARMLVWSSTLANLNVFGWGPGIFYVILLPQDGSMFYPEHAHNDALQLVFEYGIGAALPIAILAFAASRAGEREWPIVAAFITASCYSMPLFMPITSFLALAAVGRILRSYAVARGFRDNGRFTFIPWRSKTSSGFVPVAPHH